MGFGGMVQLRVLRLLGELKMCAVANEAAHWAAILAALPNLDTLALFLASGAMVDGELPLLFPEAAPVHPSLRTLQLRLSPDPQTHPSREVVEQALTNCSHVRLELHLAPLRDFDEKYNAALPVPNSGELDKLRGFLERWRVEREWSGLPRAAWVME